MKTIDNELQKIESIMNTSWRDKINEIYDKEIEKNEKLQK